MNKKEKLSAYIITLNEEDNLERALKSISFADEIIVVDAFSSDSTLQIAKEYTDKIYKREWHGFSNQRNYALDLCSHDWVLPLDADEEVTPACAEAIKKVLQDDGGNTWFKIRRTEHLAGKPLHYGLDNPSMQIRLFRKSKGRYEGEVHEYPRMDGSMGIIEQRINHYSFSSYSHMRQKAVQYAKLSAKEKFNNGERKPAGYKYFSGLAQFLKSYVTHRGFLDGVGGLCRAMVEGEWFYHRQDFLQKLWQEKEGKQK